MKIANISFLEIIIIIEIVENKVENCRDFCCLLYIFGLQQNPEEDFSYENVAYEI